MKDVLLAGGNAHKHRELSALFPEWNLLFPPDQGIHVSWEENGLSYLDNARIKAEAFFGAASGIPVLADDSGLEVRALGGAPGIFSARFGDSEGQKLTSSEKNEYLLQKLGDDRDRSACFVCALVLQTGKNNFLAVQKQFCGEIVSAETFRNRQKEPGGKEHGFGYDPIFFAPEKNKILSDLSPEEKNAVSHRGQAVRALRKAASSFF